MNFMKITIITTGMLSFIILPVTTLAAEYTPCTSYTDIQKRYQCRRSEALTHIRTLNTEFRQTSRPTILAIKDTYAKELKTLYRDYSKLSSPERKVFTDQLKDRRLASYLEWYAAEKELHSARKNLRKLTRLPNNKDLRMELIKERGAFLDSTGNMKKTRRTVVEEQLEYLRTFRTK